MNYRSFQKSDLARAALTDGAVLGWDTGLGKTIALFTWPLLKCGAALIAENGHEVPLGPDALARYSKEDLGAHWKLRPGAPVLLLAPGDLHANTIAEGRRHFRVETERLPNQDDFLARQRRDATGRPYLPPGFYLSSYTELAQNGIVPFPEVGAQEPQAFMADWGLTETDALRWHGRRDVLFRECYELTGASPDASLKEVERAGQRAEAAVAGGHSTPEIKRGLIARIQTALGYLRWLHTPYHVPQWAHLTGRQQDWCRRRFLEAYLQEARLNNGTSRPLGGVLPADGNPPAEGDDEVSASPALPVAASSARPRQIRCCHSPSLADLCSESFTCVVLDEGVRMKGDDTIIGAGVRQLNPKFRLVMSGTPIKNRLPDLFWLITWATGMAPEGSPRWPFKPDLEAKEQMADEFMVTESEQTPKDRAKAKRSGGRFKRVTAEVCNLHRLYKLLGPNLLRRRKDDLGDLDIVRKHFHQVNVPMGTEQQAVYAHHLDAGYRNDDATRSVNPMRKLVALRQAAAGPWSANLTHQDDVRTANQQARSKSIWTPKLITALGLIRDGLRAGRQVTVFSAFHEFSRVAATLLGEAGVRCVRMDGDVSPAKRGGLSTAFQAGLTAGPDRAIGVALAGIEAAAEGHNWWRSSMAIRYDLALALDKNVQSINRIHRLNSLHDVDVWDILVDGTSDLKLQQLSRQKEDAADLVLDGRLLGERPQEVNPRDLLAFAEGAFNAENKTIPESDCAALWPTLREELRAAFQHWLSTAEAGTRNAELPAATEPRSPISDLRSPISETQPPVAELRPSPAALPLEPAPAIAKPALAPAVTVSTATPRPSTPPVKTLPERLTYRPMVVPPPVVPGHAPTPTPRLPVSASPRPASPLPWLAKLQSLARRG